MAADNAAPAEPQPSEAQPAGERGFWGLVAKATALVVLISAVAGLVYKFWPQPDPVQKVTMEAPRVESGLTFRQYLERVDQDPGNLDDEVLNQKGALIQFSVEATGYKGDKLRLRWEVIDLGTHNQVVKSDAITVTPGADTDRLRPRPVFAPFPEEGGPFNVHGELFAPDGVSLADAENEFERS
jgi:hypothetical protein